jgi:tetratricopeptide (TPR) repeat protein
VDDGHELLLLRGHTARVADLAWSRDGKRVASAGGGTVRIWDADEGREILVFPFQEQGHRSLAWSEDGARLIAVNAQTTIHVWDASNGYGIESHPVESWTAVKVRYFSNEGHRLSQAERFDNARSAYGMAILLQERLVQDHSHVPEHREKLAELLGSLGLVLHSEQNYDEAIAKLKRALQIQQGLAEESPELPAYRRQLAETSVRLAKTLILQGESGEAKRLCEQAIQIVGSDTALSDLRREIEGLMPIQSEDSSTGEE